MGVMPYVLDLDRFRVLGSRCRRREWDPQVQREPAQVSQTCGRFHPLVVVASSKSLSSEYPVLQMAASKNQLPCAIGQK